MCFLNFLLMTQGFAIQGIYSTAALFFAEFDGEVGGYEGEVGS
jgi:hypothetical protein